MNASIYSPNRSIRAVCSTTLREAIRQGLTARGERAGSDDADADADDDSQDTNNYCCYCCCGSVSARRRGSAPRSSRATPP